MNTDIENQIYDVAVIGGNFTGLALARGLSISTGGRLKVIVIDKAPLKTSSELMADGRAFALSASSQKMLDVLGVWPIIRDQAQGMSSVKITDSALDAVFRPVFLEFENHLEDGSPSSWIVESHHIRSCLSALVEQDPSITLLSGCTVQTYEASNHSVSLQLSGGGAQSGALKIQSRLLVAADGRGSHLRRLAGIKTIGWSYGQTGIVTTLSHELPHHGQAVQHFLPAGPFAVLPLKGNRSSIVWSEEEREAKRILSLSDHDFLSELSRRLGAELGDLQLAGPRNAFPLHMHLARDFVANRFALLGDAAHGVHPLAGMGLNIGLRDVAALTEVIIEAYRLGLDIGSLITLETYSRWRRFDSTSSAFIMDSLNRLFSNHSRPVQTLRDIGLGLVDRSPRLKQFFVKEAAGFSGQVPKLLRGESL